MKTRRLFLGGVLLVLSLPACSSSPPTMPSPSTWTLSGAVSQAGGAGLSGAVVVLLDGPSAVQSVATDSAGRYALTSLQQGTYAVRAQAADYDSVLKTITLTANTVVDFSLAKTLHAVLAPGGEVDGRLQPDGTFAGVFTGVNAGDGCAGAISGVTDFAATTDGPSALNRAWTLPIATIVRPGERFQYTVCCLAPAEAFANPFYRTTFTFITVSCS